MAAPLAVTHFAVAKFSFVPKKYESLPYSITALHDSCICGSGLFCLSKINSSATAKCLNVKAANTAQYYSTALCLHLWVILL
jgi:hypothetical protein